jgi:CheY-like chemotaxis protein
MYELIMADDDAVHRYIMQHAFTKLDTGVGVKIASDGEELLEILSAPGSVDNVKLVVLDMHMPGLSGMQVLEKMKVHPAFEALPVVIFSAGINPQEERSCLQLGAQAVMMKPGTLDGCMDSARHFLSLCRA